MGRGRTGPLLSQGCYAKTPITEPAELTHCRADCFQKAINPQGFFFSHDIISIRSGVRV